MRRTILFLTALVGLVVMGSELFAQTRLVLDYDDQHYRGQNTLFLKRKARQQHPGVSLRDKELISVRLVAKSRFGRGQATLTVGQTDSYPETVGGNPDEFDNPRPYTFDRIRFNNPANSSQGRWQIQLRGNFKIRKVVLLIEDDYYGQFEEVETYRLTKPVFFTQEIQMNYFGRVKALKLKSLRGIAQVAIVEVIFGNGRVRRLSGLEGTLTRRQGKDITFRAPRGRNIRKIFITAKADRQGGGGPVTPGGGRGAIQVLAKTTW